MGIAIKAGHVFLVRKRDLLPVRELHLRQYPDTVFIIQVDRRSAGNIVPEQEFLDLLLLFIPEVIIIAVNIRNDKVIVLFANLHIMPGCYKHIAVLTHVESKTVASHGHLVFIVFFINISIIGLGRRADTQLTRKYRKAAPGSINRRSLKLVVLHIIDHLDNIAATGQVPVEAETAGSLCQLDSFGIGHQPEAQVNVVLLIFIQGHVDARTAGKQAGGRQLAQLHALVDRVIRLGSSPYGSLIILIRTRRLLPLNYPCAQQRKCYNSVKYPLHIPKIGAKLPLKC